MLLFSGWIDAIDAIEAIDGIALRGGVGEDRKRSPSVVEGDLFWGDSSWGSYVGGMVI